MRDTVKKTERLVDTASLFLANMAAVILLGLVALTCVDVIGRYFFASPLVGAVELVRLCMAGIIFFSFPFMFLRNDHIIVDLIPLFRRGWIGWATAIVTLGLTIVVAYYIGDRVYDYAVRAMEDGDTTEYLHIPRWPIVGFITLSIFVAAFCAFVRLLSILMTPGTLPDEHHEEGI
ncbi:TRAP transporter small permease [Sulfitobacter sp. TSTF-M16]|uniref:TRAP transporter small permease protein n=1 Tax=Sulfitobacter aestuariivivens TaxID=2766981 RepID=A0A927HGK1_9RHOB|nr:TRAP transporter small permease [Sulfitobacter aestuariivivens]MBD3666071.1 TRAP transporter small permease [Sulfitobacter aestuariivivens]